MSIRGPCLWRPARNRASHDVSSWKPREAWETASVHEILAQALDLSSDTSCWPNLSPGRDTMPGALGSAPEVLLFLALGTRGQEFTSVVRRGRATMDARHPFHALRTGGTTSWPPASPHHHHHYHHRTPTLCPHEQGAFSQASELTALA